MRKLGTMPSPSDHRPDIGQAFDRMEWKPDRMFFNDLVFRLRWSKDDVSWDLGDQCLVLFKGKYVLGKYVDLFTRSPGLEIENMLELGIYEGGSVALWRELLRPKKLSAVDLRDPIVTPYLDAYLERTRSQGEVKVHWQFDQADRDRLRKLVREELGGKLDFVIDDASHMLGPSKTSFEALFPLLRPGGLYIIEDWAWNHWPEYQAPDHPWSNERPPSELIFQLVEAIGTDRVGVSRMEVCRPFAAIFRDHTELPQDFRLEDFVTRRPGRDYTWFKA